MTRAYAGVPKLKQLPHVKPGYKGKNDAGGRRCVFAQSQAYKQSNRHNQWPSGVTKIASPWYGWKGN